MFLRVLSRGIDCKRWLLLPFHRKHRNSIRRAIPLAAGNVLHAERTLLDLMILRYSHVAGGRHDFPLVATLRSPFLPPSSEQCRMIFSYWLTGNRTTTLTLSSSNGTAALWRSSDSGPFNRWNAASVRVGANQSDWRLIFQLESNLKLPNVWIDDVAIDHISFSDCRPARNTSTLLDCDFEENFCVWKTRGLAELEWTRQHNATSRGFYASIETNSAQRPGDRALLASPTLPESDVFCLLFHFQM